MGRLQADKTLEALLTSRGLGWGHLTEGMGEDKPTQGLTTALGTAPANTNGREKWNQALLSVWYFYFYVQTSVPTASAPELWPSPTFGSFSSEVRSMGSRCILQTPTRPLCRMIKKFQRALITCFHTPVIITKKKVGERRQEPADASKCFLRWLNDSNTLAKYKQFSLDY